MLVPERALKSVGFIGRWKDENKEEFIPYGTAFFLSCVTNGHRFYHIVTARHVTGKVLTKTNEVIFKFNKKDGKSATGDLEIGGWYYHPDNSRYVDVAIAPCNMPDVADIEHLDIHSEVVTEKIINEKCIGPGDEIFIAGYFSRLPGEVKNIPIIRVGNIAAMPDEPFKVSAGMMKGYLAEVRSIGGLSGSPVFVHMAPFRVVNQEVTPTEGAQYYLLGLMHGHHDVEKIPDTDDIRVESSEWINTGIGIVVPAQDIVETIMQQELEEKRKEIVAALKN